MISKEAVCDRAVWVGVVRWSVANCFLADHCLGCGEEFSLSLSLSAASKDGE